MSGGVGAWRSVPGWIFGTTRSLSRAGAHPNSDGHLEQPDTGLTGGQIWHGLHQSLEPPLSTLELHHGELLEVESGEAVDLMRHRVSGGRHLRGFAG